MNNNWIQMQVDKYSKKNFGETNQVVEKNLEVYKILLKYVKQGMSFLDLGTNCGRIAYEMKLLGLNELGIDLPEIINKCQYSINKLALNLEEEFPSGTYDIIFCRETIEHLRNYESVIQKIFNALNPNGHLIITAPFSKDDFGKNCPEHIRIFEGNQLKELLKKYDGKIIEEFQEKRCRSKGFVVIK